MSRIDWMRSAPFALFHLALVGVFLIPATPKLLALCALSYFVRMFGITAGFHRYFSHRSFKVGRFTQFFLAFLGGMSLQKGALWWSAHHRGHHKESDTDMDIHSPLRMGFWWSHCVWFLVNDHDETQWSLIPDLKKYPELRWLDRNHWMPGVFLGALCLALGGGSVFYWAFVVSTVFLWHGTFCINSVAHVFGKRRYETRDGSKNNFVLALITLGEGWHNNHHRYMNSARQGFFWWEVDITYYLLRLFQVFGVVRNLREPPLEAL